MHVACQHALKRIPKSVIAQSRFQSSATGPGEILRRFTPRPPRDTIFSGIQPTGIPHLGNYLGALRQWKELQDDRDRKRHHCFYSIVDLHAVTVPQNPQTLLRWRRETLASLLAIGLKPEKSVIFIQSENPYHAELMWLLSTVASTGYLSRMTQWKSKLDLPEDSSLDAEAARANLKLGLFSYPVLQAADVLLYHASHVPVGEDQAQHIELARSLANSFNHLYSHTLGRPIFRVPKALISPAKRIMSLKQPTLKMSKSHPNPASRILITDAPSEIQSKISSALTDSEPGPITFNPATRPGVSNLIEIIRHTSNTTLTPVELAAEMSNVSMKAFKERVAESVITSLDGIKDRFETLTQTTAGQEEMKGALVQGRKIAMGRAGRKMQDVRVAMGLEELAARHKEEIEAHARQRDLVESESDGERDGDDFGGTGGDGITRQRFIEVDRD